jgi:glutamate racemase
MDCVVLACTHFPLVEEELTGAAPHPIAFVDGKEGIARRTAWLTRHIAWPDAAPRGIAHFTRWRPELERYRAGLAAFGLQLQAPAAA